MVLDGCQFVRKWPYPLRCDIMAKELDFWDCKLALLLIDDQSSCPEVAKNFLYSPVMFSMDLLATMMSSR
jgi:hypothetical protein